MSGNEHPSNRLVQGPVAGFDAALELVDAQFAYERAMLLRSEPDAQDVRRMDEAQAQVCMATRHAGRVWRSEQEAARLRTVERLREDVHAAEAALDDEAAQWLGLLADALEQQDYSRLGCEARDGETVRRRGGRA